MRGRIHFHQTGKNDVPDPHGQHQHNRRNKEGYIAGRNSSPHVGDRTGLEMIRTLQQKIVGLQQKDKKELGEYEAGIKVFAECSVTEIFRVPTTFSGSNW